MSATQCYHCGADPLTNCVCPRRIEEQLTAELDRLKSIIGAADFLAFDNSNPPQLWAWAGPQDESAEPLHRITAKDGMAELARANAEAACMRKEIERHVLKEWFECQAVFGTEERRREAMDRRMAEYGTAGTAMLAELDAARNLLAAIHRDGGHYTEAVGFVQSCHDAEQVRLDMLAELERLRAENVEICKRFDSSTPSAALDAAKARIVELEAEQSALWEGNAELQERYKKLEAENARLCVIEPPLRCRICGSAMPDAHESCLNYGD